MRLFEGTQFDIPPRCERCGDLEKDCECPPEKSAPVDRVPREKQTLKTFSERRKYGKTMTCIKGVHHLDSPEVLKELKSKFGCGGTINDEIIELQGDHGESINSVLRSMGFRIK